MSPRSLQKAFTLTEVLMAAGILAIGFMLIATIFPVGLKLTTMATERTVAGVVLDEAVAKIKIFDPNMVRLPVNRTVYFNHDTSDGYNRLYNRLGEARAVCFVNFYPSTDINIDDHRYSWWALLRRISVDTAQVTIFVSRRTGTASQYPEPFINLNDPCDYGTVNDGQYIDWPVPVRVEVTNPAGSDPDMLRIENDTEFSFINKGTEIMDDENGYIYTVLGRSGTGNNEIELDRDWFDENGGGTYMWVVPPAAGAAQSPCITVFQTTITF